MIVYILNKYTGEVDAVDVPQIVEQDPIFLQRLTNTPPVYQSELESTDEWEWASMIWINDKDSIYNSENIEWALMESRFPYAWVYIKPTITDNLDWTITIWSWEYTLYKDANFSFPLDKYVIPWNTFTLVDQKNNYVVANYNNWNPVIQCTISRDNITQSNIVPIYTVFRDWLELHIIDRDNMAKWMANKISDRLVRTERFAVEEGGLMISESPVRKIMISAWKIWYWAANKVCSDFDSSIDNCELWYHSAWNRTKTSITQYDNTQYDNWVSLQTLSNNRYAVNWVYRWVEDSKHAFVVLWSWDYKLEEAISSQPPNQLPWIIDAQSILVWRIIVFKWSNTAYTIDSAFAKSFSSVNLSWYVPYIWATKDIDIDWFKLVWNLQAFIDIGRFWFVPWQTTLTFDWVNTVTLVPTWTTWQYYRSWYKYTITWSKSVTIPWTPIAKNLYFIYIDSNDWTLLYSTIPWTLNDTIVPVATLYFDDTLTPKFIFADERHSCLVDRRWHMEHHYTEWTELSSWWVPWWYTLNTPTDAWNTFWISASAIFDEDLYLIQSVLNDNNWLLAQYFVLYRNNPTSYIWQVSYMPYIYDDLWWWSYWYIKYDNNWVLTPSTANKFINYFLFISNARSWSEPVQWTSTSESRFMLIPWRAEHISATAAYAELFTVSSWFPIAEWVAAYQITFNTTWIPNNVKGRCQINRVQKINSNITSTTTVSSVDHNTLAWLQWWAAWEKYHLTAQEYWDLINRTDLTERYSQEPIIIDSQPTYTLYEYTYWTLKLYRKDPIPYDISQDIFYSDIWMTIPFKQRALSL